MTVRRTSKASGSALPLLALATNDAWNAVNYRAGLIGALLDAGYRVAVLAPDGPQADAVRALGVTFVPVPMAARGKSPVGDLRTFAAFARSLRSLRPAALLGFTAKPNIYGSLAAHALGIPVINNISGLGAVFATESWLTRLVAGLYKLALRRSPMVFFQNRDDRQLFERRGIVRPDRSQLLPGSGIDLARFTPAGKRQRQHFTFLFAGRLLWDKGVGEFVEAARELRSRRTLARFAILGIVEPPGRAAVPEAELRRWQDEGTIEYLGAAADVRPAYRKADCVVLPSYYREGVPRVLLEAAAMAIPVITSDWPGCRDAVDDGVTGLLCQPRDVDSLVSAMRGMTGLADEERATMGASGRAKMEREFREDIVHRAYLDALARIGR